VAINPVAADQPAGNAVPGTPRALVLPPGHSSPAVQAQQIALNRRALHAVRPIVRAQLSRGLHRAAGPLRGQRRHKDSVQRPRHSDQQRRSSVEQRSNVEPRSNAERERHNGRVRRIEPHVISFAAGSPARPAGSGPARRSGLEHDPDTEVARHKRAGWGIGDRRAIVDRREIATDSPVIAATTIGTTIEIGTTTGPRTTSTAGMADGAATATAAGTTGGGRWRLVESLDSSAAT
jgi:hypothetical protein